MSTMSDTPAGGWYPAGAPDPSKRSRTRRWYRWGTGAALVGLLAGGGITLAVSGGGPASGVPGASGASGASFASGARAAQLNTELGAAGNAATSPARVRWALGRLRHLGVEGTVTFRTKTGFRTVSFERGTVQSVSGSDVVIKSPDGTTWTWHLVSDTVVRKNGGKTTTSALSPGEAVFAGGPVANGTRDARLIVIRPDDSAGSPGPAGSRSPGSSLS